MKNNDIPKVNEKAFHEFIQETNSTALTKKRVS